MSASQKRDLALQVARTGRIAANLIDIGSLEPSGDSMSESVEMLGVVNERQEFYWWNSVDYGTNLLKNWKNCLA